METSFSRLPPHWSIFFTGKRLALTIASRAAKKEEDGGAARSAPSTISRGYYCR
jgi:hypothetical protein